MNRVRSDYFYWPRKCQERYRIVDNSRTPLDRIMRRILHYPHSMKQVMFPINGEDCLSIVHFVVTLERKIRNQARWINLYRHQRDLLRVEVAALQAELKETRELLDRDEFPTPLRKIVGKMRVCLVKAREGRGQEK